MVYESFPLKIGLQPIVAFIPLATLVVNVFHNVIPFKWVALFTALQVISLLAFYANYLANDFLWCLLAIGVYFLLVIPVYVKLSKKDAITNFKAEYSEIIFSDLFKKCAEAFFSDYRISLLSKVPLVLQVLVGGSFLYGIFGADWVLHSMAGFGIGMIAMKAYTISVNSYGYGRLASYFHLDRYHALRNERKYASAEFTLFSVTAVAFIWEIFESAVHTISPINVFRVGEEPLWNTSGDITFAIIAGMVAWYLLYHKVKWL